MSTVTSRLSLSLDGFAAGVDSGAGPRARPGPRSRRGRPRRHRGRRLDHPPPPRRGEVDELTLHLAPVTLGAGESLFAGLDVRLEPLRAVGNSTVHDLIP
ncbi:hypothetical protein L6E12_24055 [Actinokineospora sp. PR83]|uniref:hypothetical protein n=1 Tax=Actinokineospora sp. PR83 TaxID=2884908 RepID=UPI001F28999F|nr:hypothetical protein [Actinokineospora sp. PR83]MCG8918857.1 hypothetical protein [Actinokineospora sp. PR83]